MPRGTNNSRGASGGGSIRKKVIKRNGKEYQYWEARYTSGYNPKTGRQIQHSITGKTQKEVAQKMGISQSYISRLEKRIMLRLKKEFLRQTSCA